MLTIDEQRGEVVVQSGDGACRTLRMDSAEAFEAVSAAWLRCGWDVKYVYSFTWLGRPLIQLPEDMLRMQELLWRVQPDVLIETGVAHGGSLVFYAGLFAAIGRGRVIGVDIEFRPANRAAIEGHVLAPRIQLVEGSSVAPATLAAVRAAVRPGERVLVVMADFALAPRGSPDWSWNNPLSAVDDFMAENHEFIAEEPGFAFNEGRVRARATYWPRCFLRRLDGAA
jgi:hypothetical protein